MEKWIAHVVGLMHIHNISQAELANRIGVRRDYLNKILNGKICPKDAESRVMVALESVISEHGFANE